MIYKIAKYTVILLGVIFICGYVYSEKTKCPNVAIYDKCYNWSE